MYKEWCNGLSPAPIPSAEPGVYHVGRVRARLVSAYNKAPYKRELIQLFSKFDSGYGRPEEWDLHHIFEKDHFADIDYEGNYELAKNFMLPCVWLHEWEHEKYYSSMDRVKETKSLFLAGVPHLTGAKRSAHERSLAAKNQLGRPENRAILESILEKYERFYTHFYNHDSDLKRIAMNIIQRQRRLLVGRVVGKVVHS